MKDALKRTLPSPCSFASFDVSFIGPSEAPSLEASREVFFLSCASFDVGVGRAACPHAAEKERSASHFQAPEAIAQGKSAEKNLRRQK